MKLISLLFMLFLVSCAQAPAKPSVPTWLMNPSQGVVASCGFHIGGHYQQQECAIQRARERLAAQQGVEVSSMTLLNERVVNDHESVSMNKQTEINVKNKTVKARVKETYYDASRDEYYVWLVPH